MIDIYPPDWFGGPAFAQRVATAADVRHQALKQALKVPTTRYLWVPSDAITFTPAVSDVVYGDGRALMKITTLNDRPAYWIVRVDSRWAIDAEFSPYEAPAFVDYVEHIVLNLALEFGDVATTRENYEFETGEDWETGEDFEALKYPAIDLEGGSSWGRLKWPACGFPVEPHPYWRLVPILASTPAAFGVGMGFVRGARKA